MSSNPIWTFINGENPNETIQIHDQASAAALKSLLSRAGGNWEVREQLGPVKVATAATPVPVPTQASIPRPVIPENERRSQKRFATELRVILISGSHSFRTLSQDVSLGGMKLKKTIPPNFLANSCIAYVSHKDLDENLEMVCNVIADPTDPCRIKFEKADQDQLKRLNEWLEQQNSLSK